MPLVRSLRLMVAIAVVAVVSLAVLDAPVHAQPCNADAGCSNGVKPNHWLPNKPAIGSGKATGYISFHGEYFYGEYRWFDYVRPGGGYERFCSFAGEQIVCPL